MTEVKEPENKCKEQPTDLLILLKPPALNLNGLNHMTSHQILVLSGFKRRPFLGHGRKSARTLVEKEVENTICPRGNHWPMTHLFWMPHRVLGLIRLISRHLKLLLLVNRLLRSWVKKFLQRSSTLNSGTRIKYDRTCQRSIQIISIEKTFALHKSAQKKHFSWKFVKRKLLMCSILPSENCKFSKMMIFLSWMIPLIHVNVM